MLLDLLKMMLYSSLSIMYIFKREIAAEVAKQAARDAAKAALDVKEHPHERVAATFEPD